MCRLLEQLAKEAGFALELPANPDREMQAGLRRPAQLWRKGGSTSVLTAIRALTEGWAEIVLEDRAVRLIPRSKGGEFWKAWASPPR